MVNADLGATTGGAVVVEERPWQVDNAAPVEGDDDLALLRVARVGVEGDDGAGTVAHVGLAVAVGVKVPVRRPGRDTVTNRKPSLAAARTPQR